MSRPTEVNHYISYKPVLFNINLKSLKHGEERKKEDTQTQQDKKASPVTYPKLKNKYLLSISTKTVC